MATRPKPRPLQIARFLAEVQVSEITRRQYSVQLERYLMPWLQDHHLILEKLSWGEYLEFIRERGWSYSTAKQNQSAVRKLLAWKKIKAHPLQSETLHRVESHKGYALTPDDLVALDLARSPGSDTDGRSWAMLLISFHCALRSRELVGLRVDDLDFEGQKLYVRDGKGGRREDAPFHPEAQPAVRHYLEQIRPRYAKGTDALWVSIGGRTPGQAMTAGGWRRICHTWGQLAGVPRFSPHTCRRGFAHWHTRRGVPTVLVMRAGRWTDFKSFQRYVLDLNIDDFMAADRAIEAGKAGSVPVEL